MDKHPLIVVSLCAVILLVLGSLSNVVGYQSVQTSQQNLIKERINQKELLFQTICDIANNKQIQRIILKSQISRGISPPSDIPVITKNQLKMMYLLGLLLSRFTRTSILKSLIGKYQFNNQEMQKEISTVIEKDKTLNAEITQLKDSECDCDNRTPLLELAIICDVLRVIFGFFGIFPYLFFPICYGALLIAIILHCYWTYP
jgi:hypothetical protein